MHPSWKSMFQQKIFCVSHSTAILFELCYCFQARTKYEFFMRLKYQTYGPYRMNDMMKTIWVLWYYKPQTNLFACIHQKATSKWHVQFWTIFAKLAIAKYHHHDFDLLTIQLQSDFLSWIFCNESLVRPFPWVLVDDFLHSKKFHENCCQSVEFFLHQRVVKYYSNRWTGYQQNYRLGRNLKRR